MFQIIYLVVFSIIGLAIILLIADWLYLLSLSSRITSLEQEVEKKGLEYDILKKERQSSTELARPLVSQGEEPDQNLTKTQINDNEAPLEVVRNVRNSFRENPPVPGEEDPDQQISSPNHISHYVNTSDVQYQPAIKEQEPETPPDFALWQRPKNRNYSVDFDGLHDKNQKIQLRCTKQRIP